MRDLENEPPSLYTADVPSGELRGEDSDPGGEGEGEGEREEWESVEELAGNELGRFESSYRDYMSLGVSRETGREGRGEAQRGGERVEATAATGLFGTLSSLLSSTFSRTTS